MWHRMIFPEHRTNPDRPTEEIRMSNDTNGNGNSLNSIAKWLIAAIVLVFVGCIVGCIFAPSLATPIIQSCATLTAALGGSVAIIIGLNRVAVQQKNDTDAVAKKANNVADTLALHTEAQADVNKQLLGGQAEMKTAVADVQMKTNGLVDKLVQDGTEKGFAAGQASGKQVSG